MGRYVVYGIQRAPRAKPKAVHRDRLWKYRGEERAHYFTEAPEEPVGGGGARGNAHATGDPR